MKNAISQRQLGALALAGCAGVLALSSSPPADGESGLAQPRRPQKPTALSDEKGCASAKCHANLLDAKFVHGPVAVHQCTICHAQNDKTKHDFRKPGVGAGACTTCHNLRLRATVHAPVANGQCGACHDPHESNARFLLRATSEKELCAQCHDQTQNLTKKFVHGPVATGACSLCHRPHSSYYPKLLDRKGAHNCLNCHSELEQQLKGAKHWHRPVSEDCATCHDAHASDHPYQLKTDAKSLCLDCHRAKKAEIESATVFHEALTAKDGCKNCHNTHASRYPKLLDKPVIETCLGCHDKPQVRPDQSVVPAMGKRLRESKYLHGPVREGNCSSCHNPHGSKNFSLLRTDYPKKFYAAFDMKTYTLCFTCHDSKVFTSAHTATLTNFRDGSRNLHYLHVNKETKGRTCRACHMTHASNLPKHMAEKVPFGGWEIPINFEERPTGGSCSPGCHKPRTYDYTK